MPFASDLLSVAILLIAVSELVAFILLRRQISREHDWIESRGTVGEQFGEWLTEPASKEEGAPSNLAALSAVAGTTIAKSMRMSAMQEGSVDARHFNSVDEKVFEALKDSSPEARLVAGVLEQLGLGDMVNEQDLPYIMQKYGHLLGMEQAQGNPSRGSKSWKLNR